MDIITEQLPFRHMDNQMVAIFIRSGAVHIEHILSIDADTEHLNNTHPHGYAFNLLHFVLNINIAHDMLMPHLLKFGSHHIH